MSDRRHVDDARAAEWAKRLTDQSKPSKATARRWVALLLEDRAKDRAEIESLRVENAQLAHLLFDALSHTPASYREPIIAVLR